MISADADAAKQEIEHAVGHVCGSERRHEREASTCRLRGIDLDSATVSTNQIHVDVYYDDGSVTRRQRVTVNTSKMAAYRHLSSSLVKAQRRMVKETILEVTSEIASESKALQQVDNGFGLYMNIMGTIDAIETGKKGAIVKSSVMTSVSVVSLIQGSDGAKKLISRAAVKTLGKDGAEKLGKAFNKMLPVVGIAFDLLSIAENSKKLTEAIDDGDTKMIGLYSIHLAVDTVSLTLNFVGLFCPVLEPILAPLELALSIFSIAFDSFYLSVWDEIEKVKGGPWMQQVQAVLVGWVKAQLNFATGGYLTSLERHNHVLESHKKFVDTIRTFNHADTFYSVREEDGKKVLDFTNGTNSYYGGLLSFNMADSGAHELRLDDVLQTDGRSYETVHGEVNEPDVDTIVLGVGGSVHAEFFVSKVKFWLLTVEQREVIVGLKDQSTSFYGKYSGNTDNNVFLTVAGDNLVNDDNKCAERLKNETSDFSIRLTSYRYIVEGRGGDDVMVMHHQQSTLRGGTGADTYVLQSYTQSTVIDNFSIDDDVDLLQIGVNFEDIQCVTSGLDLVIRYCSNRTVTLDNYYDDPIYYNQHLRFMSFDGFEFEPIRATSTCQVVAIDKTKSKTPERFNLTDHQYSQVATISGSNFSDVIIGNDLENIMYGGLGADTLVGGRGTDRYMVYRGSGCDVIDVQSDDNSTDIIIFEAVYENIELEMGNDDSLHVYDNTDRSKTCFSLQNWGGNLEASLVVVSTEKSSNDASLTLTFQLKLNSSSGEWIKWPLLMDMSQSEAGWTKDLSGNDLDRLKTVKDSPFSDVVTGNAQANMLSCSGGDDAFAGRGNSDAYVVKQQCESLTVDNYDPDKSDDFLLVDHLFQDITVRRSAANIELYVPGRSKPLVSVTNWFSSEEYRHLTVQTIDGIEARLPQDSHSATAASHLLPVRILRKKTKNASFLAMRGVDACESGYATYDLSQAPWTTVQAFQSQSSNCNYDIIGNELNNRLDPGPGNRQGYQSMSGGNGSDLYVIGHRYGMYNKINNYATDKLYDHIKLGFEFDDLEIITADGKDLILRSDVTRPDGVIVENFLLGEIYQHLIVHTSDGVIARLTSSYPYYRLLMVDLQAQAEDVTIADQDELTTSEFIKGALNLPNSIQTSDETQSIQAGTQMDVIVAGDRGLKISTFGGEDDVTGGQGNDAIYAGSSRDVVIALGGDDFIYGGSGADYIDGGEGVDSVEFAGDGYNARGVDVNLLTGTGRFADAEGDIYVSIENVYGTPYNDTLTGNDADNVLFGRDGNDTLYALGAGSDLLVGGSGSDIYVISLAYGHKAIISPINDTLRTDDHDVIQLPDTNVEHICSYSRESNLVVVDVSTKYELTVDNFFADAEAENFYTVVVNGTRLPRNNIAGSAVVYEDVVDVLKEAVQISVYDLNSESVTFSINVEDSRLLQRDEVELRLQLEKDFTNPVLHTRSFLLPQPSCDDVANFEPTDCHVSNVDVTQAQCEQQGCCYDETRHFRFNESHCFRSTQRRRTVSELYRGERYTARVAFHICSIEHDLYSLPEVTFINPPTNPADVRAVYTGGSRTNVIWSPPDAASDRNVEMYQYSVYLFSHDDAFQLMKYTNVTTTKVSDGHVLFAVEGTETEQHYQITVRSVYEGQEGDENSLMVHVYTKTGCDVSNTPEFGYVKKTSHKEVSFGCLQFYFMDNDRYLLEEEYTVACGESPPPCIPVYCDVIPVRSNRLVVMSNDRRTADVSCDEGYEFNVTSLNERHVTSQCDRGVWIPAPSLCRQIASCTTVPHVESANLTLEGINQQLRHGAVGTFRCHYGYAMVGNEQVKCENGVWSELPQCNKRTCVNPTPSFYRTGSLQYEDGSEVILERFEHGDRVRMLCKRGFYHARTYNQHQALLASKNFENVLRILNEQNVYACDAGEWQPRFESDACVPLITKLRHRMYLEHTTIDFDAALDDISHSIIDLYGTQFCGELNVTYLYYRQQRFYCGQEKRLSSDGPDEYQGYVEIGQHWRWSTVCVDTADGAGFVCDAFGFPQYTSSLVRMTSRQRVTNKYLQCTDESSCQVIMGSSTFPCSTMVRCRSLCTSVTDVHEGHGCSRDRMLEGERCYQDCHYAGSPGWRTCGSDGNVPLAQTSCYAGWPGR